MSDKLGEFLYSGFGILTSVWAIICIFIMFMVKKEQKYSSKEAIEWAVYVVLTFVVGIAILWGWFNQLFTNVQFPIKALVISFSILITYKSLLGKSIRIWLYKIFLAGYAVIISISIFWDKLFKYVEAFDDVYTAIVVMYAGFILFVFKDRNGKCEKCEKVINTSA